MKPLIEHLEELRRRFIILLIFYFIFLIIGVIIAPLIINRISKDILPHEVTLVSLSPLEFIYTQLKVGFVVSLVLTFPLIIYHLIRFFKPGLKRTEISAIKYILPGFLLLLLAGILFGYCIFLNVGLFFLANLSDASDITNMWSIHKFISFVIWACFTLGIVFELPLILLLLNKLKIINRKLLKKYRAHVYVFAFIIAAIITPPDAFTQIMVAIPLIILYEGSSLLMRIIS